MMLWRRRILYFLCSAILAASFAGCVTSVTKPNSWVSNTRFDVKDLKTGEHVITGESSSYGILFGLFQWGDRGYEAALRDAKQNGGIRAIAEVYDVRTDRKYFNVLGLYVRATTVVTASVAQ